VEVELLGTSLVATTDSSGRYRVADVLPGRYELRMHRSGPGDAGAFIAHRSVELRAGDLLRLDLPAPSDTGVAAGLCPGWTLRSALAPVVAILRDARRGQLLRHRVLEMEWSGWQIGVGPVVIKQRTERRNVTTDWRGEFVSCELPERADIRFRDTQTALATWSPPVHAGYRLLVVDLMLDPANGTIAWRTADSSSANVVATAGARPIRPARLVGTVVRSDSPTVALPDVEVRVEATDLTTRSDARGEFRLDSVPDGWYVVGARRPGFAPSSSATLFRLGEASRLRFSLEPVAAELTEVRVEERQPLSIGMMEFEQRRKAAIGKFIGPEVFEKYTGPTLSGLILNKIPGFDIVPLLTRGYMSAGFGIASKRYQIMGSGGAQQQLCFAKIVVNGHKLGGGRNESPLNIDELKPGEVVGMEFYRGASEVPTEFSGPDAACGVVVIWTRQR
jgi:hypothetical protein